MEGIGFFLFPNFIGKLFTFLSLISLFGVMVRNPDLIRYVCIAKGTTVLAELDSKCSVTAAIFLENTPPYHASFTHTVRSKTYSYLIDNSFVYFAIFDEKLGRLEGLGFLKCVKDAFAAVFKGERKLENLTPHCFQEDLNPVFRRLLGPSFDRTGPPAWRRVDQIDTLPSGSGPIRDRTKPIGEIGINQMKKRLPGELKIVEQNGEKDNGIELSNKFPMMLDRNGGIYSAELAGHQRAKKVWKKQVWVVLSLDLIICVMLFGVWLWVCRGLKCIDS